MSTSRERLLLIAYAPRLEQDDGRPLHVVEAMESALPGLRLPWAISDQGELIPVAGAARGMRKATDGDFPLLCNGNETHLVTLSCREWPYPGKETELEVHAEWPMDEVGIAAAAQVLESIALGARSYWAQVTPDRAAHDIALQTSPSHGGRPNPPRGLPKLKLSYHLRASEIPHYLGWLNYWSPEAARAIGFPEPERDEEWLFRARRTASGGWMVRLTDAPLDLDNPIHLDTLLRAYERFPEIGGRAPR